MITGQQLKAFRENVARESQVRFAASLGISPRTMLNWEKGGVPEKQEARVRWVMDTYEDASGHQESSDTNLGADGNSGSLASLVLTIVTKHDLLSELRRRLTEQFAGNEVSGAQLKEFRNALHESRSQFADRMGVSPKTVYNWEVEGVPARETARVREVMNSVTAQIEAFSGPSLNADRALAMLALRAASINALIAELDRRIPEEEVV